MFIAGKRVHAAGGRCIRLPYDGSTVAEVPNAGLNDLDAAIAAADSARPAMRELSNAERSELLLRLRGLLQRDAGEFARLLVMETGKPIKEARAEAERAVQTVTVAAMAARELAGEAVPMDAAPTGKGRMAMTIREPLGIIGAITPFNMPLNLALHKIAPALAGGNTVVHKPSETTPLSALKLAEAIMEAGAPAGAYNVVTGDGPEIGGAMVRDDRLRMITFTGSMEVGRQIRANAGLKRVTLELGGNSPLIVEPDADLDLASSRAVLGAFSNSGQVCISVQRIFVHDGIADSFLQRLRNATESLIVGHPLEEATDISSLITEEEAVRVESWINDAVAKGAALLTGGARSRATIRPAILAEVPDSARMSCNEIFGPVVAVSRYSDLNTAIQRANSTPYGLQAGIFTQNIAHAFEAARKLEAGGVMINDIPTFRADHMPYGGTKNSGLGREGPRYAIEEMTEVKLICWR